MHIVAPVTGVVAQRTVQIGQQIAAGTPLMAVVPLRRVWVDANFRETQLNRLRIGQPATITSDTYGGDVVFHGHVVGLAAGSGNAFALLPPQNASGNWIKIVQRSEEHTSELQSLMRISYAVFCLNTKNTNH